MMKEMKCIESSHCNSKGWVNDTGYIMGGCCLLYFYKVWLSMDMADEA